MPLETTDGRFNQLLKPHLLKEFEEVLRLSALPSMDNYEWTVAKRFAQFVGTRLCTIVDSGTTALKMALCLAGVKPGDEVIVPAVTFASTFLPIVEAGARPVMADVDDRFVMDPAGVAARITPKTKAILPVHLFGHVCDMDGISRIAREHGLKVIEDACQSHGSTWKGRMTGGLGDIGCFSFTTHKSIPCFAGGAICYNDLAYEQRINGMTYVTDDDPAIVPFGRASAKLGLLEVANLSAKLKLFPLIQKSKDATKAFYAEHLAGIPGVRTIPDTEGTYSVRQHVVAEFDRRDELLAFLRTRDISIDPAYPPVSASKLFGRYVTGEQFPMAERYHARVAHLPSTPFIGKDDLARTVNAIREFYGIPAIAPSAGTVAVQR